MHGLLKRVTELLEEVLETLVDIKTTNEEIRDKLERRKPKESV